MDLLSELLILFAALLFFLTIDPILDTFRIGKRHSKKGCILWMFWCV